MMFSNVDLPEPEGPSSTTNSPSFSVEIHVVERVNLDFAHVVDLGELAYLEERRWHHRLVCDASAKATATTAESTSTSATAS